MSPEDPAQSTGEATDARVYLTSILEAIERAEAAGDEEAIEIVTRQLEELDELAWGYDDARLREENENRGPNDGS